MPYKVVPFTAAIGNEQNTSALASRLENLINEHTDAGWQYMGVHQLQTFRAGSNGCFGIGASPAMAITTEFIVFRK